MSALQGYEQEARSLLRQRGERVTSPRAAVLAAMLAASAESRARRGSTSALTHQELSSRLESEAVRPNIGALDRVTLYRVLEWMVEIGLAHKIAGDDRVFRFSLNDATDAQAPTEVSAHGEAAAHAHFHCTACRRIYCLAESPLIARALQDVLPRGFVGKELAVAVHGLCPDCARKE